MEPREVVGGHPERGITCVGSDHSTIVPKPDKVNKDIWSAVPGFPGSGMLPPIMLIEGYHKGRASLEQITAVLSTNNARVYGIYSQKGTIEVRSDADFAIVDVDEKRVVTPEYMQSFADWGLYDGWELSGWPTLQSSEVRWLLTMERSSDPKGMDGTWHGARRPRPWP